MSDCTCADDNLRRLCGYCRFLLKKPACAWCLDREHRVLNLRWVRCDHTPDRV